MAGLAVAVFWKLLRQWPSRLAQQVADRLVRREQHRPCVVGQQLPGLRVWLLLHGVRVPSSLLRHLEARTKDLASGLWLPCSFVAAGSKAVRTLQALFREGQVGPCRAAGACKLLPSLNCAQSYSG